MLKNEVIIVRFDFVKRNEKVLKEGIFHFDNKLFIVKSWSAEMVRGIEFSSYLD